MSLLFQFGALLGLLSSSLCAQPPAILKDAFAESPFIGAELNEAHFFDQDAATAARISRHLNSVTPENALKRGASQTELARFDFAAADRFVAIGEKHGLFIFGHTPMWHSQTPAAPFEKMGKPASREVVLLRQAADPALNPYVEGLPHEMHHVLAGRCAELFAIDQKHCSALSRVKVFRGTNGDSWLKHRPIPGRSSHTSLFDRKGNPELAFYAVVKTLSFGKNSGVSP